MSRRGKVGRAFREARALLTQARYLPQDLSATSHEGRGPTVVLLHGLYASAGVFRPLRSRLESELEASTYSLSYPPGPGIETMCERLAKLVAGVPSPAPIILVGHSFGALVERYYVSQRNPDPRVVQTVSLAAPFLGSNQNTLVPGQGGRDLAPDAELLALLRQDSEENRRVPHLAILAEEDSLIVPGAYPSFGRHHLVRQVGHNGILFHPEVIDLVTSCVREHHRPTA